MSLLSQVQRGKEQLPPRLLIYGWEGVGKSTCGNTAPAPIFIDAEDGLAQIDCARFPRAKTIDDVFTAVEELRTADHTFRTVVLDTADAIERMIHTLICQRYGVKSIEKAAGGYGKGYVEAAHEFERLLTALEILRREKGMVIIFVAHAKVEKFFDPDEGGDYDRYSPRLHKTAGALLKEWSDAVLFATRKMIIQRRDDNRSVATPVGAGGGARVLKTEAGPACVAKNRYGMAPEIPMNWAAIVEAITKTQVAAPPNQAQATAE
jgi:hypothetical protein